jgi:hypothetical protein
MLYYDILCYTMLYPMLYPMYHMLSYVSYNPYFTLIYSLLYIDIFPILHSIFSFLFSLFFSFSGSAYIHGLKFAKGDFIIIMDADMSHHVRRRHNNIPNIILTIPLIFNSQSLLLISLPNKLKEIMTL